ncbi:MAG: hypothetical protein NTY42_14415 [Planctomycetota bacterium]|nr:hypothetical protein [Planctomycetota bacterium]
MMKISVLSAALMLCCVMSSAAQAVLIPFSVSDSGDAGWTGSNGMNQQSLGLPYFPSTKWIRPNGAVANPLTSYTFTYTFTLNALDAGFNPIANGTAIGGNVGFKYAVDNSATVKLNTGAAVALPGSFTPLSSYQFMSGLVAGTNTLLFTITNEPNTPTGFLLLEGGGKFESEVNPNVVPEPISLALWGGLAGFGLFARRRFASRK